MTKSKRLRMSRASRWTPAQARSVLEDLERSGLSVRRFAAQHGLGVERLYRWKRRLQRVRSSVTEMPRFAEVTVRPPVPASVIEIELPGGVAVHIAGESRVDDAVAILSRLPAR